MHEAIIKPPAIKEGDTIKVVAPSSPLTTSAMKSNLSRAIDFLKRQGFKVDLSSSVTHTSTTKYYTAGDRMRAEELENAFKSDDSDMIIALRGGAGSIDLLNMLDYDIIKEHPKIFVGYSDLTLLELAMFKKTGLVTFQGPMLQDMLEENQEVLAYNWSTLLSIIKDGEAMTLKNPPMSKLSRTIIDGKARGRLIGGTLSMVALIADTEYMPDVEDKIMFLEDVNIEPWEVDNLLTSLVLRGVLQKLSGIFFGEFIHYGMEEMLENENATSFLLENFSIDDYIGSAIQNIIFDILTKKLEKIPSFVEFTCCHGNYITTVPIGINAELDSTKQEIKMLESAVEPK